MTFLAGPRGSTLVVEHSAEIPMAWMTVAVKGGAAADPNGVEGFTRHMAQLARRGAGGRDRAAFDEAVDQLGATLSFSTQRDSMSLIGISLSRNLDAVVRLAADVLARPRMDRAEHDKLLRETRANLDEIRDDDSSVAARFFNLHCVPGHPYGRSVMGTEASLDRIELDAICAAYRARVVPANLLIGFAGDVDAERAMALAELLVADLADEPAPPLPDVSTPAVPAGRRLYLIDKPERSQSQILMGHLGPRYGCDESLAFTFVETVFGGTFTSRLMQEIRVKRGWSYGAGCALNRSRGANFFQIYLAPSAEVTPEALTLTMSLYADLVAQRSVTAEEFAFVRKYLAGSIAFSRATARQRLRTRLRNEVFGLPRDYADRLPERIHQVTIEQVHAAARRWMRPDDAITVLVATKEVMAHRVQNLQLGELEVATFNSY